MSQELISADAPRWDEMAKVVDLYSQNINPTRIAKELGIRRVDVLGHLEEWRKSSVGSEFLAERAQELVASLDTHYSTLIRKFYEIVSDVDGLPPNAAMIAQKNAALKNIAELERQRIDVLQKAGLLDGAVNGDAVAEMEENVEMLMSILNEELCESCKNKVWQRLAQKTGVVNPLVVND